MPNFSVSCSKEEADYVLKSQISPSKIFQVGVKAMDLGSAILIEELNKLREENSKLKVEFETQTTNLKTELDLRRKVVEDLTKELNSLKDNPLTL